MTDPTARYPASMRWLHWSIFGFVLIAYVLINIFEWFPRGSAARMNILTSHYLAGLAVLLLILPRVWLRKQHVAPPIVPSLDRWSDLLYKITHLALYLFLLIQPILGIVTLQIAGKSVSWFGVTLLPSFVATPDRAFAHQFEDIHATLGEIFYWVIGLHILAALWHHFGRRDNTLKRMV
ncbi:MAG: cytochrome b [Dokdonella sp.]